MADVVLSVVETDLRLLAAEAKKAEGPMTNLMGMLHHSDLPAVRDATERALQKVRNVDHGGLLGVQQAVEILAPFALACDTKYAKLACIALSAFQKLLANDAVSIRGRCEIIKALQAAERLSDESVKLRILQASLTIIQSPSFADEQDAIQQLLSLLFRLYVNNKSNFAVHSTAAATIRQAVALIFDHSVIRPRSSVAPTPTIGSPAVASPLSPAGAPSSTPTPLRSGYSAGGANSPGPPQAGSVAAVASSLSAGVEGGPLLGREVVPVLLLEEIMGWLGGRDGKELGWIQLQQRGANKIDRTFLLEMLEAVLLQRASAIHRLPGLTQCLRAKVAPAVSGLLDSACDRMVDPNDAGDCRLVVRCAAALVRRHNDLAPDRAAAIVVRLAETAGSVGRPGAAHRWQRFMALQALKPMLADPPLLYRLYHLNAPAADKAPATGAGGALSTSASGKAAADPIGADSAASVAASEQVAAAVSASGGNVVPAVIRSMHDALRWYVRTAIETPEDDVVAALGNLYQQRAMGARDSVQETEAFGTNLAHGSEVVIAHLALECVLAMVAATEALTDVVVVPAEPGMPSPKLITRDTPEVRCVAVAGLVAALWRSVLAICNTLLARAGHDVLVGLLVRGLQGITYSAGALGVMDARDSLLHALCSHTLLPPGEDDMAAVAAAASMAAAAGVPAAPSLAADDRSVGGNSRRSLAAPSPVAALAAAAGGATPGLSTSGSGPAASASSPGSPAPTPGFLTAILVDRSSMSVRVVLTPRNIAALRSLFNLAHRLADGLGSTGWLYVVDAVNALDRILASPHTTTAAYLMETASEGDGGPGGLQPMTSSAVPLTSGGTGGPGPAGSTGGAAGPGAALTLPAAVASALDDGPVDDLSTTAQRELRILASAADQLFENTHHMSPEAVVSLLSALSDISHRTLSGLGLLAGSGPPGPASSAVAALMVASAAVGAPAGTVGGGPAAAGAAAGVGGGSAGTAGALVSTGSGVGLPGPMPSVAVSPAPGAVRLCALNRMVDTLLHNLWRIQDLWGIFLAHVLEVLGSSNVQVRAAAVDALDRTITGALNPDQHVPDKFTAPLPAPEDALSPVGLSRRDLLPTFPSFAMGPASASVPIPVSAQQSGGAGGSRRSSRDIGGSRDTSLRDGAVYGTSTPGAPGSAVQPTSRRVSGSGAALPRPSTELSPTQPILAPTPGLSASPSTSPFAQSLGAANAANAAGPSAAVAAAAAAVVANRGVQQAAQREDVQHMLLVALDSLYREGGRSPDVRHGLLRIALHVLQHHGDGLTRGWVPLLRLLEAVPRGGLGPADVRLGFQVVEILATDYLASSLPKEHVAKALDVIAKFAMQDVVLNVSLTSITMLWNVTDHLARSRGTFSKASASAAAAASATAAAAAASTATTARPPQPQQRTVVTPTLSSFGGASAGSSPFGSSPFTTSGGGGIGGDTATPPGERQMSPAFAAALSFARGVPTLPAASASPQRTPQPTATSTSEASPPPAAAQQRPGQLVAVVPPAGGALAGAGGSYPLHDLDEAESIAMLMIAFRCLKALSVDPRPEARNAAVRTLFLAVGSHGGKFPSATWHELFWSLLFDLLVTIHRVSASSSVEEAAAVELGKEKGGRSVVMLVHHSRNSEQKQWDETLVLALAGAAKVIRSYLPVLSGLDVWGQAWEQLMQVLGDLLASGRKGVAMASTSLLTTVLQTHGSGPLVTKIMWKQTLTALDRGVVTMAAPNTSAPLQARAELLACISTLSTQLLQLPPRARIGPDGDLMPPHLTPPPAAATALATATNGTGTPGSVAGSAPDPEQLMLILRWLDRFARYPVGADDSSPIHFTTIGPIQKAALAALAALPPSAAATGSWPEVLALLCNMLRPFSTLVLRQHAQQVAAVQQQRRLAGVSAGSAQFAAAAATPAPSAGDAACSPAAPLPAPGLDSMPSVASSAGTVALSSREPSAHGGGSYHSASAASASLSYCASPEVLEARAMSPMWMARVVELLATWYRDHVSWQVRVATFPLLVGAMSECMACRHLMPGLTADPPEQLDDLWRTAARGFVTVVQTGLPSINIIASSGAGPQGQHHLMLTPPPQQQQSQPPLQPQQLQVPQSTWPALARAFQMFFLAANLPPLRQPPGEALQALAAAQAAASAAGPTFRRISTSGGSPSVAEGGPNSGGVSSQPLPALHHATSPSPATAPLVVAPPQRPEQVAADLEITTAVLDCLSETVLSSCQHAPVEVRKALVEVLDAGAASMATCVSAGVLAAGVEPLRPYDESVLPPTSRLSHVSLNKLYVLCSRGQEPLEVDGRETPAARSQLEVAQLALPVFVSRCEVILFDYTRAEHAAKALSAAVGAIPQPAPPVGEATGAPTSGAATPGGTTAALALLTPLRVQAAHAVPVALHDKARHVLELLGQLKVIPIVSDSLLPVRPHLRFWFDVLRAVRAHAAMPQASLAAAAATAAAAAPGGLAAGSLALTSSASIGSVGGAAGLLSPPALSRRRSSSGAPDVLASPKPGGAAGSVAGDAPAAVAASNGGPTGRSSSSSFFSRTYSSTGALLTSAAGHAGGAATALGVVASGGSSSGMLASLAGVGSLIVPSPKRPSGGASGAIGSSSGSGGGVAGSTSVDGRGSGVLVKNPFAAGTAGGGPTAGVSAAAAAAAAAATLAAAPHPSQSGKLAWVKEQPQLLALYGVLCGCIGSSDPAIRSTAQGMLAALGGAVGLCAPLAVTPPAQHLPQ